MNDDDLSRLLDSSFGDGPASPAPAERLVPARRALRRRRLASGGVGAAVVAVALTAFAVVGGGSGSTSRAADPAVVPGAETASTSAPPTTPPPPTQPAPPTRPTNGEDVDLGVDGALLTAPGVRVIERIDNPLGSVPPEHSLAVAYTLRGEEYWALLDSSPTGSSVSLDPARKSLATLGLWVDQMAALNAGDTGPRRLVGFEDDRSETLRPSVGARILAQSGDVDLAGFAGPEDRSAVALVEYDGQRWFVLARDAGGPPEYLPTSGSVGGRTIAEFLDYAAAQYGGGEGLR